MYEIKPLRDYVLVTLSKPKNITPIILEATPLFLQKGTVVDTGPQVTTLCKEDVILFGSYAGAPIDDSTVIMREQDILAKLVSKSS